VSRAIHKLTPDRTKQKSTKEGLHGDGGGLYLCVTSKTAASWVFRFMLRGNAREMGLGSYPEVSLDEARERAREARKLKAEGRDPIEVRDAGRASQAIHDAKTLTFRHCAERYIAAHSENWTNAKHAAQWTTTLEAYVMPILGGVPVAAVDRALVIRVLEPVWKTKTPTASRLRGRIEAVLDWAAAMQYRDGDNPARYKGPLQKIFPTRSKARMVKHHSALPFAELPAFMASLKPQGHLAILALQFAILTAARTGEVVGAKWTEIDLEQAIWTVPGSNMKGRREHRVPLSKPVLTLLRKLHELSGGQSYVFPGGPKRHIGELVMIKTLYRMGRADITVHGFRSTFRDWVEETTNYSGAVAEAALAHVVGDKVEAAYRRGDLFEKRRKLMAAWATFCTTPAKDAEVIPIGRKVRAEP
jgi:integrase